MLSINNNVVARSECDADYTEWRNFNPHRTTIRPSIKTIVCCIPTYPLYHPPSSPPPKLFWQFWKIKHFLALFSSENHEFFPWWSINLFFPTYLLNQKLQGRGTANKHFFKDGLIDSFSCFCFVCLCWGLTSQSTIFQSCRDGATASWVINQYFQGVKCLAQGHNTAAVGFEPPTSRKHADYF